MGRTLSAVAAVLVVLALPPGAAATSVPVDDPRGAGLTGVALDYWHARGVSGCADGIVFFYDDSITALGTGGGCVARLNADAVASLRAPGLGRFTRRFFAALECHHWTHEVGHALGLPHAPAGVMASGSYAIPSECRAWARATYPPRAKRQGPRDSGASRRVAR